MCRLLHHSIVLFKVQYFLLIFIYMSFCYFILSAWLVVCENKYKHHILANLATYMQ